MAVLRERPYPQFNFLVDLGTGTEGVQAGFQECGPIGMSVDVIEYRNGNHKENEVIKLTGLARVNDVTLRRGLIGSLDLYDWRRRIVEGTEDRRAITIQQLETPAGRVANAWRLERAWPCRWSGPAFNAVESGVAYEELELAFDDLVWQEEAVTPTPRSRSRTTTQGA